MKINDVISLIISVVTDWKGVIINPQPYRYNRSISWTKQPRILDEPILASDVLDLIEDRQYTFQVVEGRRISGIIQVHYLYGKADDRVDAASLAFYSTKPLIVRNQKLSIEIEEGEDIYDDINSDNVGDDPVGWLRIDYAPDDAADVVHNECHMHLSGFPDTRFMVCGVPNPKQFVEMIMASFYPQLYRQHRMDAKKAYKNLTDISPLEAVNSNCIIVQNNSLYAHLAHFRIPFIE